MLRCVPRDCNESYRGSLLLSLLVHGPLAAVLLQHSPGSAALERGATTNGLGRSMALLLNLQIISVTIARSPTYTPEALCMF